MKLFISLLILSALIQTSFLPINLVLILLLCRSFVTEEKENYFLAFFGGIFLGLLSSQNIGVFTLFFLIMVKVIYLAKKLPLTNNFLTILPLSLIFISLSEFLQNFYYHQTLGLFKILIQTILTLPIFWLIKFNEERFVIREEIKLKIGK